MSESTNQDMIFEEERIDLLLDNADGIIEQKEEIRSVFEETIGTERKFNNFDLFFRYLSGCLYGKVDEEEQDDVTEALLNTVNAFSTDAADRLCENGEKGQKLFEFITELEVEYGVDLDQRTNRIYKGHDWWSNIRTQPGYRSGRPHFTHEIIKDYDERVVIGTDAQNTLVLARHLINEVENARTDLGEDILDYIDPELVRNINDLAEELEDAVVEYNSESNESPETEE
ncbi:hypothetical protein [Haloarcula pellucida]|uniref:Uncharacterized protein n=1 Tax=Haloarcula pellucida TaxID=1427151 RepID=A0A830GQN0_9EURY|nr:hypothetical protein [Halomicroarcula pellucida]MBX0348065.1 hypothetical protein [Halomicroarcula pellucida]GGN96749.1 hypothetical protein GCM10009030_25380 [Halomicroarcula pellucida]